MYVEGVQGNLTWWDVLAVGISSAAFIVILYQKAKFDLSRKVKYNRERNLKAAQARVRLKGLK